MPTDHLTTAPPHELAAGVLAVLAGADPVATATDLGINRADLDDAVEVYQAAGLAALEQRAERECYQVRVEFADWNTAETTGARLLGPRLNQLQSAGAVAGWWFLRKHPCWRLRLHGADTAAVDQVLDKLIASGLLTRWWPTVYEPETAAFGGPAAMDIAHALFCADSRGVLDYARQKTSGLGRRELSVLLINTLLGAAGLDFFERGDVFARVAKIRPAPSAADHARLTDLVGGLRTLLSVPATGSALFTPGGPVAFAAPWLTAFETAGLRLGEAAAAGAWTAGCAPSWSTS
ncbi:thiopeptide-type bacteriocin biosynthesis protein [Planomonospora algeriensis]